MLTIAQLLCNIIRFLLIFPDDEPDIKKGDVSFIVNRKDDNVLHIHVNEMKRADNILRVSITLNIRSKL